MPIDREARREVISALSAFMRGEIDNFAIDDAIHKKLSRDPDLEAFRISLWFLYDDCKVHRISVPADDWDQLRRMMAFLKSDLEKMPVQRIMPAAEGARFLLRLGSLLSVIAAGYLAITDAWYWLLLPGVLIGLPYCVVQIARGKYERAADDPHPFYPFSSDEQWRQYEPLLVEEHLPDYSAIVQGQPIRSGVIAALFGSVGMLFSAIVMPFLMILWLKPRK